MGYLIEAHDSHCQRQEAKDFYGIDIMDLHDIAFYDVVIAAVSHTVSRTQCFDD